jgi:hypothetical protein
MMNSSVPQVVLLKRQEPTMANEIELISDGDGLAVIGAASDVERFLSSEGLLTSRDLELPRLTSVLHAGSIAANTGSAIAAQSGRWVKLTEKSAELIKEHGLMKGSEDGLSRAIIQGKGEKITGIVEIMKRPAPQASWPSLQ